MVQNTSSMEYRYLGNSGLKVSVLSYGNWLNSKKKDDYKATKEIVKKCFEAGINYFDTSEIFGLGAGEEQLGKAIKELKLKREELVIATKIFRQGNQGPNDMFLSRKHIKEGVKNSLKRLQLDYVDVVFA